MKKSHKKAGREVDWTVDFLNEIGKPAFAETGVGDCSTDGKEYYCYYH